MAKKEEKMMKIPGMAWRVSLSIIVSIGWLAFIILWLFFYAQSFTIYQNIAIFIVSILVAGAIMGASWASFGMKYGHKFEKYKRPRKRKKRR